jgi:sporulation protein YlmC with PRC-barrel domain
MAQEAIRKTGRPTDNVYVVIIEDDYPKLSSFCVIPSEAFGWGWASRYETNYQWPKAIKDTTIVRSDNAVEQAKQLGREIMNNGQYDCVWIGNHQNIDVVKR